MRSIPTTMRLVAIMTTASVSLASLHSRQSASPSGPSLCKLPAVSGVYLSEGFGSTEDTHTSTTGTLQATMIFVDFPDAEANDTAQSLYDLFVPGAPDWYATSSYGKLDLQIAAPSKRFYRMPAESTTYGYERGLTAETHLKYIQDALDAVGDGVSFEGSEVLYIVPTTAATAITFSPTYQSPVTAADGTSILKTVTFGQDAPNNWGFKTMNHETGHAMGLPDLYSFDGSDTTRWTGGFDIMSLISGVAPDFTAWHKWRLGWLADEQIACITPDSTEGVTVTLSPLETRGEEGAIKALVVKVNDTTALAAEARTSSGVDTEIYAEGVLVYAVYNNIPTGEGPIRVFDSRPGSGGCGGDELNDAPYDDATFESAEFGISMKVSGRQGNGWSVSVRRG